MLENEESPSKLLKDRLTNLTNPPRDSRGRWIKVTIGSPEENTALGEAAAAALFVSLIVWAAALLPLQITLP